MNYKTFLNNINNIPRERKNRYIFKISDDQLPEQDLQSISETLHQYGNRLYFKLSQIKYIPEWNITIGIIVFTRYYTACKEAKTKKEK